MDYKKFSKRDLVCILEIIEALTSVADKNTFQTLLLKTKDLLEADTCISAVAKGNTEGAIETIIPEIINGNYSIEWLETYNEEQLHLTAPTILYNFECSGTQIWENSYKRYEGLTSTKKFVSLAEDHNMHNGLSTGFINTKNGLGTIIAFTKKKITHTERQYDILNILNHHFHQALARLCTDFKTVYDNKLTPKELEVLKWMKEGKTSWEISMILNRSENTISFHSKNIIQKLDASNKSHALAIAMEHQLLY